MQQSPRLGLPYLAPGQAQKELTHNESLLALDALVQGVCVGPPSNTPPVGAAVGQLFLCGDAPTGAWAGNAFAVAQNSPSGWRFVPPFEGMALADHGSAMTWHYRGGDWTLGMLDGAELRIGGMKVVGERRPAITNPAGGPVSDSEARAAINAILATLRQHGLIAT